MKEFELKAQWLKLGVCKNEAEKMSLIQNIRDAENALLCNGFTQDDLDEIAIQAKNKIQKQEEIKCLI